MTKAIIILMLHLAALGVCHAQSGSFIIPTNRAGGGTDFAYWDLFNRPPGSPVNINYNYANPPALLDGTGEDVDANPTTAFAPRATLTQTGTPNCFITSSGAIYSFSDPIAIEVHYQPPAGNNNEVTNVIFQAQTGGARIDVNTIRLRYTDLSNVQHELAPVFKGLDDPQTGAFSERLVSAYQWNLTGLGVKTFKITFPGPTSMPIWQAQLDVVQGTPFVQQLGYIMSTRARPLTRHERPGAVDKNLAPGADGRFFVEGQLLNLLGEPEIDWEHTGWYYDGQTYNTPSLPLAFPAQDILVTALFAPTSYDIWREFMFYHANALLGVENEYLDDEISAPEIDHDGDGLDNAGEYAFTGDPYTADEARTRPQWVLVEDAGQTYPAIRYRTNGLPVGLGDLVHIVQINPNNTGWTDNNTAPVTTNVSRVLQPDGSMLVTERALQPVSSFTSIAMRVAWSLDGDHGEPLAPADLELVASSLPSGFMGTAYQHTFTAQGGASPYTWTVSSGTLPVGLTLSTSGVLSGVPSSASSAQVTVQVTDGLQTSRTIQVTFDIGSYAITSGPTLPNAVATLPYETTLAVQGGTGPFEWELVGGSLPSGLTLQSNGVISGTSTVAETTAATIQVTDANNLSTTAVLQITAVNLIITTPSTLPGAVLNVPYSLTLTASGGVDPFGYDVTGGVLPAGIIMNGSGQISGTPTVVGNFNFTVTVTDAGMVSSQRSFTLVVHETYQVPVLQSVAMPVGGVGSPYTHTLSALNYPKTFAVSGLPAGLKLNASTGVISGRPSVPGVFAIQVRATNVAGSSTTVTMLLTVKTVPLSFIGSFAGWVERDAVSNASLGSSWSVTTTSKGTFTAKLVTAGKTASTTGFLATSAPHVVATVAGQTLSLSFNSTTHLVTGTHGAALAKGWRAVWNAKANPAMLHAGYYSAAFDLANVTDEGVLTIPQGTSWLTFTVPASGNFSVAGKTADGQTVTSSAVLGPDGQFAIHSALYKKKGSLLGELLLDADDNGYYPDNRVTGQLTWLKPATTGTTYPAAFGPLELDAEGGYLSPSSRSGIVLGLPETGNVELLFTDGGLASSATDPDLAALFFTDALRFVPPVSAVKHKLTLNKSSGLINGSFTLTEPAPLLVRKVSFQAQVVRRAGGTEKAVGWFLLRQISTPDVLSGGVLLRQ